MSYCSDGCPSRGAGSRAVEWSGGVPQSQARTGSGTGVPPAPHPSPPESRVACR